ncbi:MAG TPA: DUF1844 domain-containing protein [Chthonomonadaceae bacterium]|nr:DUF1844 domain-containing protein [Chthonomonadaceae bacterium]
MTDQDPPAFTVVDKRRAAQKKAASEPHPESAAEESTVSSTPEEDSAATTQAPPTEGSSSESKTQEEAAGEDTSSHAEAEQAPQEGMPALDPIMLLSLAAMQLDVRTFVQTLLGVFDAYAWQAMGLVANPATGEPHKDLPAAQLAIDCLQFLLGKAEADLSEPERREVQRRLNDLRMNYLAKLRES